MVDLGYYDDWYYEAPWWHKGIGVLTMMLVATRWIWQRVRTSPPRIVSIPDWQHYTALLVHGLMNLSILILFVSGYLIVTAKGDPLAVFDWFSIPALLTDQRGWADGIGKIHRWSGWFVIILASLHALAALKHHFMDRDGTLKRMLAIKSGEDI
jgi:cytochrome b561